MTKIYVRDPLKLDAISDIVHDTWLDVDSLEFDEHERIIKLSFEPMYKETTEARLTLKIANVVNYELIDTEKIGLYDVCCIDFAEDSGQLRFRTGVPLSLTVRVDALDLVLED